MTPSPVPTPIDLAIDPNRVTPGMLGFISFIFLIVVVVVLYFSMRKQLSRIKFDEDALPAGVRALPKYATREERRKSAAAFDAARAAAASESQSRKQPRPTPAAETPET
ncbi:MAG: hypothetical protein KDC23_08385 [Actinobacteria bacterium]|nr:hypothetical protein [Actinomycetota bacterium]